MQFETIHPFLDGNGRIGRLLIVLLLYESGALSQSAVQTARRLVSLFQEDAVCVRSRGRSAATALRVFDALRARPIITLNDVRQRAGLTFPTATSGMTALVELGIARELTGRRRNRVFAYERYLAILNEGTEPL